jgi:serine phosphatase RsbU (regulator of sigma subunit)
MMSLIGHLLLNDIAKYTAAAPAQILERLHAGIVSTLKQADGGPQTSDGMDIALCRIDRETGVVEFAGAHRPVYHISQGALHVYAGDKCPIGGTHYSGKNQFTNHVLPIQEGDTIYLFSDGLTDQFGGPGYKKMGCKRVQEILLSNVDLPMREQHNRMRAAFDAWKGPHKQVDDLLMIGIRF